MQDNDEIVNLNVHTARSGADASGWVGKVLTFATGAALLVVGFVFSLLVFALVATAAVLILGLFWWKTRAWRQQLREQPPAGRVIDGEAIREARRP